MIVGFLAYVLAPCVACSLGISSEDKLPCFKGQMLPCVCLLLVTVKCFQALYRLVSAEGLRRGASGEEPACQCRRLKRRGFNPWSRRSPGEGSGCPLEYSCLGNPIDRGAWAIKKNHLRKCSFVFTAHDIARRSLLS